MRGWRVIAGCCALGALGGVSPAPGEEVPHRVPGEYLEAYFGGRPDRFLVDPQGLLSPGERRDREDFLRYHAGDSEIDFRVLLFDRGQELPGDLRVEELAERFSGEGRPTLLALYHLGEPERAGLQLSPAISGLLSPAELARIRGQAVRDALARADPAEQLEAFCVQLSIGIYWIEREAGLGDRPPGAGPPAQDPVAPPDRPSGLAVWFGSWWSEWGLPVAVIGGGLLCGFVGRWLVRRRARYRFPGPEAAPRLGAGRGGGVGALIDFRSSSRSPSGQKGGPDDSLGGL